ELDRGIAGGIVEQQGVGEAAGDLAGGAGEAGIDALDPEVVADGAHDLDAVGEAERAAGDLRQAAAVALDRTLRLVERGVAARRGCAGRRGARARRALADQADGRGGSAGGGEVD